MDTPLRREFVPTAILSVFLLSSVAAFAFGGLSDIAMDVMIGGGLLLAGAIAVARPDRSATGRPTA